MKTLMFLWNVKVLKMLQKWEKGLKRKLGQLMDLFSHGKRFSLVDVVNAE